MILKIRRPGIGAIIETDLRLHMRLANVAEAESDEIRRFRPREIVTEFARSIRRELDLANECHNAERIVENFWDMSYIHVPRVHWEWTSERMNVQNLASGLPGTDLDARRVAGLDLRIIAARGTEAVLKMIFEDRFFMQIPIRATYSNGPAMRSSLSISAWWAIWCRNCCVNWRETAVGPERRTCRKAMPRGGARDDSHIIRRGAHERVPEHLHMGRD